MSRKKTEAQIIEGDNNRHRQEQAKRIPRSELSELCREYLEKKELFRWFIEKYFGLQKYLNLWDLAEQNKESQLYTELTEIWYKLPDSIFNVRVSPEGWDAFLRLVEK